MIVDIALFGMSFHLNFGKFSIHHLSCCLMSQTLSKIPLMSFDLKEALTVEQPLKKVSVMFIHGSKDNFILLDMDHKIYDSTLAEKELCIVTSVKHNCAYRIDQAEYMKHC
jgi:hypothetical protein